MKNQQVLFLVIAVVIIIAVFSQPTFNIDFSIIDGDQQYAGLEVWNSNSVETHTFPSPVSSFKVLIEWTNAPLYFYEYGSLASKCDSVFKFVDALSTKSFSVNCAYDSNYWDRFDGVLVSQKIGNDFVFSNYYGATFSGIRTLSNPNTMTYTVLISYSSDHLIVNVNGQKIVDNRNLKGFKLSAIELSNPSYNGADQWNRYEWEICEATWSLEQYSEESTPYPNMTTEKYIDYDVPLLTWNSGQEYFLSDMSIYQGWNWISELQNWTLTMSMNDFAPQNGYGDFFVRIWSNRANSEYMELRFDYDVASFEVRVYDSFPRLDVYKFKSSMLVPETITIGMSNTGSRVQLLINNVEILDDNDLGAYPFADFSWSGDWYTWEGTSSVEVEIVTDVEVSGGGFPWWIIILIVVALIVLALMSKGKK